MLYAGVEVQVVRADALAYPTDLLALKYAQQSYGVDKAARDLLDISSDDLPSPGRHLVVESSGRVAAKQVAFVGTEPIENFDYRAIRDFARRALVGATQSHTPLVEIAFTLHGIGFGLDEIEAFESEVAGVVEAIEEGWKPQGLRRISFVERDGARAGRMQDSLASLLGTIADSPDGRAGNAASKTRLGSVGYDSMDRSHAFVAMPFDESFSDVFHYGISRPIRARGLLCERMDKIHFTGDIIERMKSRISAARIVVADLSGGNSNVYLEIGYAWGVGVPCVLVCRKDSGLKFDVRGHRCIFYGSIRELEEQLFDELAGMGI